MTLGNFAEARDGTRQFKELNCTFELLFAAQELTTLAETACIEITETIARQTIADERLQDLISLDLVFSVPHQSCCDCVDCMRNAIGVLCMLHMWDRTMRQQRRNRAKVSPCFEGRDDCIEQQDIMRRECGKHFFPVPLVILHGFGYDITAFAMGTQKIPKKRPRLGIL